MNGNDFSRLSYKELQALALRYRVPGNIKKKLLVKVLQAAKGGNENEVGRLLQDLKQTRKKRVRKIKTETLGLTSTPSNSPNYVMADDYYCPQQQPPYQWVAAEEEIVSRDDNRIPHYEEFKQFLLRRIQREFQTYDANNNEVQDSIVDLRSVNAQSNMQTIPIDTGNYLRSNIIAVNNADSFVYQSNSHVEYQTLEDLNNNTQGSILLKKMLQAPVGANLGEIASPVLGNYRLLSMDQYQSNDLLDNSDTLTAESDNENEANLENTIEYGLLSNAKGEYFLNEPTFVRNVDEIDQHISNVSTNETAHQYRYSTGNIDTRQSYDNWTVANVMETADPNCATPDVQTSKVIQNMYYDNAGSDGLSKATQDDNLMCQYRMADNAQSYGAYQNLLNLNPAEETQYYETNIASSIQSDSPNAYSIQNLVKYHGESAGEYFQNLHSSSNANMEHDPYASTVSQNFANNNHYSSGLSYEYPYAQHNEGTTDPLAENLEEQQQPHSCDSTMRVESGLRKDYVPDRARTSNGILEPFWPKSFPQNETETVLENILNFYNSKCIDLSKVDQTSCVYCYVTPIVTHTASSQSSTCSQKERFFVEQRQHSFSSYWLLYDDSSYGMRMANFQSEPGEIGAEVIRIARTSPSNSQPDIRESAEDTDNSITEVWARDYSNYEAVVEKSTNICENINIVVADNLLSVITTDPLVSQEDDIGTSQTQ